MEMLKTRSAFEISKSTKEKILKHTKFHTKFYDIAESHNIFNKLDVEVTPQLEEIEFFAAENAPESSYIPSTTKRVSKRKIQLQKLLSKFEKGRISFCGPTGSGKTTLLKAIARDVIAGKHEKLEKVEVVHFIQCKGFGPSDTITPGELLFSNTNLNEDEITETMHFALHHPEKILFVLDSLDTLPYTMDGVYTTIGLESPSSPEVIMWHFLSGTFFPGSRVITAAREYTMRNYKGDLRPDKVVALTGLTEQDIGQIVSGYMGNAEAVKVMDFFRTLSPSMMSLCQSPIFLVFSLIVFKMKPQFTQQTMSSIMVRLLQYTFRSPQAGRENAEDALKKLAHLAYKGTQDKRVLFTINELATVGLETDKLQDFPLLSHGKSVDMPLKSQDVLFFQHLSIQETLAAFYIAEMSLKAFSEFVSSYIHTPQYAVVRRILCGLLLDESTSQASHGLFEGGPSIGEKKLLLKQSLQQQLESAKNVKDIELFISLYEAQDGVTDIIQASLQTVTITAVPLSAGDIYALASVISRCKSLRRLWICDCILDHDCIRTFTTCLHGSDVQIEFLSLNDARETTRENIIEIAKLLRNVKGILALSNWDLKPGDREYLQEQIELVYPRTPKIIIGNDILSSNRPDEKDAGNGVIGPEGGRISLRECEVIFSAGAVKMNTRFYLELDADAYADPQNYTRITPMLSCTPSMKFSEPVTVRLATWCSTASDDVTVDIVSGLDEKTGLKTIGHVNLHECDRMIVFECREFSPIWCAIRNKLLGKVNFHLTTGLYYNHHGNFNIALYSDAENARKKCLRELQDQGFHPAPVMLNPLTLKKGDQVNVSMHCRGPQGFDFDPENNNGNKKRFLLDDNFGNELRRFLPFNLTPVPQVNLVLRLSCEVKQGEEETEASVYVFTQVWEPPASNAGASPAAVHSIRNTTIIQGPVEGIAIGNSSGTALDQDNEENVG